MTQQLSHNRLNQRVALVTGAARGIGRAIALKLSSQGAHVAIHYRSNAELAESLALKVRADGSKALVISGDLSVENQARSVVNQVTADLGPIEFLVNNAVAFVPGELADLNDPEMEMMWRTNVGGPIHLTRFVADGMKERRFGRIVNVVSAAGFGTSVSGTTFYAATKAALSILTRRFAMELGPYGITVNAVSPGFIPTEGSLRGAEDEAARQRIEFFAKRAMLRRVGCPEDIAHAVGFLVSPEASFITAQILTVDGGRMDYISHS